MNRIRNLSRRAGLATGAKAAFAVPAVIAGLRGGTAFAHSGSGTRGSGTHGTRGMLGTSDVKSDVDTTDTRDTTTTGNTTTTIGGVSTGVQVLGRARLCRVANDEHRNAGKLRLLLDSSGVTHLVVSIKRGGESSVTFVGSPNGNLNGTVLQLTGGRGVISGLSDDQVAKLLVADSKDFQAGFHLQIVDGSQTHNFVVCSHKS